MRKPPEEKRRQTPRSPAWERPAPPWSALDGLAVLAAWALAVAVARMPILTPDVWWHLATGQLIMTGEFPRVDPFSWSLAGAPWFLHEWLADTLMMQVYESAALLGIVALRTVLLVAAFLAAYRLARLHAGTILSLLLLAPAAWASQRNWLDRPQLWTFLLLPLLVWLLETTRQNGIARKTWVLMPLLFVAWANLHGGFMLGLAVVAVWTIAVLAQSMRPQHGDSTSSGEWLHMARRQRRGWVVLMVLAGGATLATPHGVEGVLYPLRYVGSGLSESLGEERVGLLNSNYARVHLLLAVLLCATFVRRLGRACWAYVALGLFLVGLSLPRLGGVALPFAAERHAPLFLLAGVPLLAWQLQLWLPAGMAAPWQRLLGRRTAWAAAAIVVAVGGVVAWRQMPRDASPAARLLPGRYPVAATNWLQQNRMPQRLLNPYRWGGWLLFHLSPAYTVSIDSRGDLYGIERIRESELLHQMPPGAEAQVAQILERDAIDVVIWHLLTLDFGPLQAHPFADWLLQSPEWRLVFWDRPDPQHPDHPAGTTGVFLRDHRRNHALLQAHPAARLPPLPGQRRRFGFPPQR